MGTTAAWAHLPNAEHIDKVLAHLQANPTRWDAARDAARDEAWGAAWDAAWGAARDAGWGALLALIAYDDCAYILSLPPGAIRLMVSNEHPAATLLNPAVIAMKEN